MAVGLGTGCSGSETKGSSTGSTGGAAPTGQATVQPVRGGTLRVVFPGEINPKSTPFGISPPNQYLTMGVYDALTNYPLDSLDPRPVLAESWKFAPDFSSLTINLRKGVKWHSGRPLTAEDVKWNIQMAADPATASQLMNFGKWVQKFEIPDPNTLVLQFDQARPSIFDMFNNLYIADPQTWDDSQAGKRFVGTGPFMFKEWVPGDHFTLVRNPDYWRQGLPYFDDLTERIIPDAQTRLLNLQTDAADVADSIDPLDLKQLQGDKKYNIVVNPVVTQVWCAGCDVKAPALADKRVRQAISYLIDRQRIVDTHLAFSEPMVLPWGKTSPAYDADLATRYPYNPAKAKELLAQVGSDLQTNLTIYTGASWPQSWPMADMLQAELTKLGWKVDIQRLQSPEFTPKLTGGTFRGIWLQSLGFMHMTPSTLFVMSFPYRIPNGSNFDSPEYRQLTADILKTADQAELKTLYRKMNELLLDECFFIPIAANNVPITTTAKIRNFQLTRGGWPFVSEIWKTK